MVEIIIQDNGYIRTKNFGFNLSSAKSLVSKGEWAETEGANDVFPFDVLDIALQHAVRKLYGKTAFFRHGQDRWVSGQVFKSVDKGTLNIAVTGDVDVTYIIRSIHSRPHRVNVKDARSEVARLFRDAASVLGPAKSKQ